MKIVLSKGEKLPYHSDYSEHQIECEFWEDSYIVDKCYVDGMDANGNPIIPKSSVVEKAEDYRERKRHTTPRNYCQEIIDRYTASIFRTAPKRWTSESTEYNTILNDADGYQHDLTSFMSNLAHEAQVCGQAWSMVDWSSQDSTATLAQSKVAGDRPFLRLLDDEQVVNWNTCEGYLLQALVVFADQEGQPFARLFDKSTYQDCYFDPKTLVISEVSEPVEHGYLNIPICLTEPFQETSQIAPIAEQQKAIAQLISFSRQEIIDQTFTRWLLSGADPEPRDAEEARKKKLAWSTKRIMTAKDSNAKMTRIASDVTQADSIRKEIEDTEKALFRIAGLGGSWQVDAATQQSGVSRLVQLEGFYLKAKILSDSIQHTENYLLGLLFDDQSFVNAVYDQSFQDASYTEDLAELRDTLALDMPDNVKALAKQRFIEKYFNEVAE